MTVVRQRTYLILLVLFAASVMLGPGVSYHKVYLYHLLFAATAVVSIFQSRNEFKSLKFKTLPQLIFVIMPLWYAITILWSWNRNYSLKYLILVLLGCGLAWFVSVIGQNRKNFNHLLKGAVIVVVLETMLGLLEVFTPLRWPISPFSTISNLFGSPDSLDTFPQHVMAAIEITPTGFQWNPNHLALTLTMAMPFVLLRNENIVRFGLAAAMFMVIVMTGSRLCILATSIIILTVLGMRSYRHLALGSLIYISLLSAMVYFSSQINTTVFGKKIYEIATLYDSVLSMVGLDSEGDDDTSEIDPDAYQESGVARMILMKNGFDALIQTKGLGVGGGASVAVQEKSNGYIGGKIKSMHNFWVEMMVDAGVLFFLLFVGWYIYTCRKLYIIGKRVTNPVAKYHSSALLLSMILFVPAAISASSVIYFLPMWLLFGLSVAHIINHSLKHENAPAAV